MEKPGKMGKFAKWYKCELLKRVQDQTGGGGLLGTVPGAQLSPLSKFKTKSQPRLERNATMRSESKAALYTWITILLLNCIWELLELIFYKDIQPRIVDDIMALFFIPFIYLTFRYAK